METKRQRRIRRGGLDALEKRRENRGAEKNKNERLKRRRGRQRLKRKAKNEDLRRRKRRRREQPSWFDF